MMADNFVPREGIDFIVTELYGQFHWESAGSIFGDAFCNEDSFNLPSEAAANAVAELSGATDLDFVLTNEERAELAEKTALLYSSTVQDLKANVQCLPARYRERSFYTQVMQTPVPPYLQMQLL